MTTQSQPTPKHTPTPTTSGVFYHRYVESADSFHYQVNSPTGLFICRTRTESLAERGGRGESKLRKEVNAIVTALNSSMQLKAAVDGVLWHLDRGDLLGGNEHVFEVLRRAQRNAKEDLA